ncbi:MAG: diacylglycerol kinase [Planctomycetota bacterium]|jgi:diacylglycerol kinase (ATP)|nr:diacylglycerol kinase [Planctomycetota bacterium]
MIELLKRAPWRFRKSLGYCRDGFRAAFQKEESFRLECLAFAILLAGLALSSWPAWKCLAMTASFLLIPLVEAVNSALEDVCDLVTREHSASVKNAKDKGALAVLLAILVNAAALLALWLA